MTISWNKLINLRGKVGVEVLMFVRALPPASPATHSVYNRVHPNNLLELGSESFRGRMGQFRCPFVDVLHERAIASCDDLIRPHA